MAKESDEPAGNWSKEMTAALLGVLLSDDRMGKRVKMEFERASLERALEVINKKVNLEGNPPNLDISQVESKITTLRSNYDFFVMIKEYRRVRWDEANATLKASPAVWGRILKEHPDASKFQTKGLQYCHTLTELFSKHRATGKYAITPMQLRQSLPSYKAPPNKSDNEDFTPPGSPQIGYHPAQAGGRKSFAERQLTEIGRVPDRLEEPRQPDAESSQQPTATQRWKRKATAKRNQASAKRSRRSAFGELAELSTDPFQRLLEAKIERAITVLEKEYSDFDTQEMAVAYRVFDSARKAGMFLAMSPSPARVSSSIAMMKIISIVAFLISAIAAAPALTSPDLARNSYIITERPVRFANPGGVYYCEDAFWGATCIYNIYNLAKCHNVPSEFNDKISSFGPDDGTFCFVYEHENCKGASKLLEYPGSDYLSEFGFNDRISAFACLTYKDLAQYHQQNEVLSQG
ncbi:hypothetical protein BZA77DRAFT_369136 [Pyronema omphalodes]|nr:hypothetical protein BZA77DRAFT_369136 [Pyronema omphalodes]